MNGGSGMINVTKLVQVFGIWTEGFNSADLNVLDEFCEKAAEGVSPKEGDLWRWMFSKLFEKENHDVFEVLTGGFYYKTYCDECKKVFNYPVKKDKCIACGSDKIEHSTVGVGKIHASGEVYNSSEDKRKEFFKDAVNDLRNHPPASAGQGGVDWVGLRKNLN
jgi:hypothetical protein